MPRKEYYEKNKDELMDIQKHKRAKQKRKREEKEAKEEYIKPVSEKYPISWERYKELWGESVSFQSYLEDKRKFEEANRGEILKPQIEQILQRNLFPLKGFDCKKFRLMITGYILPKDSFFCANHHTSCESCIKWFHEWKDYNKGCNPW